MHGHRHSKIFHLVAVNQRSRRDAKPTELLGIYNPHMALGQKAKTIEWSVDRIRYWLHVGAIPSKRVVKLLELGKILTSDSPYHSKSRSPTKWGETASSEGRVRSEETVH